MSIGEYKVTQLNTPGLFLEETLLTADFELDSGAKEKASKVQDLPEVRLSMESFGFAGFARIVRPIQEL